MSVLNSKNEITDEDIDAYLEQCKASGRADKGRLADVEISKVDLAKAVSEALTEQDLSGLDSRLQGIVAKATELAFAD